MRISDTPFFYFFKTTPPILPTAPNLWEEKLDPPPLSQLLKEEAGGRMRGRSNDALPFSS